MELVQPLDPAGDTSPLAAARLHKGLTVEEAARRTGLSSDEVEWLEAGRVYRFPSTDAAIVATLLYATGLGLDHREARIVAGLPSRRGRWRSPARAGSSCWSPSPRPSARSSRQS